MSSEQVVSCAWDAIALLDEPPAEFHELARHGSEACLKRPLHEFRPRPAELPFDEAFALRAMAVDFDSHRSVRAFLRWAAAARIGEDPALSMVALAHRLDHLLYDVDDGVTAIALARDRVPALLGDQFMARAINSWSKPRSDGRQRHVCSAAEIAPLYQP